MSPASLICCVLTGDSMGWDGFFSMLGVAALSALLIVVGCGGLLIDAIQSDR